MGNLLAILPMAFVMIAGPQIISAILLTMSMNARRNSLSFLSGVALAVTIGTTISYSIARRWHRHILSTETTADDKTLDYFIVALLVILAVLIFRYRSHFEPPKWIGKLRLASSGFSFKLGLFLFLFMPGNILIMLVVGSTLAQREKDWWLGLPFVALTVLLAALPFLVLLLLGKHADTLLPKARDALKANSWMISEFVIVIFLLSTLNDLR